MLTQQNWPDLFQTENIIRATNVVATGAVLTPVWWSHVHAWSSIAADLLPIVGISWIGLQAAVLVYKTWFRR